MALTLPIGGNLGTENPVLATIVFVLDFIVVGMKLVNKTYNKYLYFVI